MLRANIVRVMRRPLVDFGMALLVGGEYNVLTGKTIVMRAEQTLERDHFKSASEAKEFGLIDEVIDKRSEAPPELTEEGKT
jgi:hypothetical protein